MQRLQRGQGGRRHQRQRLLVLVPAPGEIGVGRHPQTGLLSNAEMQLALILNQGDGAVDVEGQSLVISAHGVERLARQNPGPDGVDHILGRCGAAQNLELLDAQREPQRHRHADQQHGRGAPPLRLPAPSHKPADQRQRCGAFEPPAELLIQRAGRGGVAQSVQLREADHRRQPEQRQQSKLPAQHSGPRPVEIVADQ